MFVKHVPPPPPPPPPALGLLHRGNKIIRHTYKESWLLQNLSNINYLPTCSSRLVAQHSGQVSFKSMQWCRRSWEDKLKCVKILSVKDHNSAKICNYLPTCTSRLVVQHPCQLSFKSMQGCRRRWEDKLKYVKILNVKGHNSAKICRTWIISPHALLDLWYNICTKFHSNPCKDVGGVEKTNFDGKEGRNDGQSKHSMPPCHFMAGA